MKIKVWIKYEESYLPPRCRKFRYRECEENVPSMALGKFFPTRGISGGLQQCGIAFVPAKVLLWRMWLRRWIPAVIISVLLLTENTMEWIPPEKPLSVAQGRNCGSFCLLMANFTPVPKSRGIVSIPSVLDTTTAEPLSRWIITTTPIFPRTAISPPCRGRKPWKKPPASHLDGATRKAFSISRTRLPFLLPIWLR